MSLFRSKNKTQAASRPSLLLQLRLVDKVGDPLEEDVVWKDLLARFKDHPNLEIFRCEIRPDKDGSSISED